MYKLIHSDQDETATAAICWLVVMSKAFLCHAATQVKNIHLTWHYGQLWVLEAGGNPDRCVQCSKLSTSVFSNWTNSQILKTLCSRFGWGGWTLAARAWRSDRGQNWQLRLRQCSGGQEWSQMLGGWWLVGCVGSRNILIKQFGPEKRWS